MGLIALSRAEVLEVTVQYPWEQRPYCTVSQDQNTEEIVHRRKKKRRKTDLKGSFELLFYVIQNPRDTLI